MGWFIILNFSCFYFVYVIGQYANYFTKNQNNYHVKPWMRKIRSSMQFRQGEVVEGCDMKAFEEASGTTLTCPSATSNLLEKGQSCSVKCKSEAPLEEIYSEVDCSNCVMPSLGPEKCQTLSWYWKDGNFAWLPDLSHICALCDDFARIGDDYEWKCDFEMNAHGATCVLVCQNEDDDDNAQVNQLTTANCHNGVWHLLAGTATISEVVESKKLEELGKECPPKKKDLEPFDERKCTHDAECWSSALECHMWPDPPCACVNGACVHKHTEYVDNYCRRTIDCYLYQHCVEPNLNPTSDFPHMSCYCDQFDTRCKPLWL